MEIISAFFEKMKDLILCNKKKRPREYEIDEDLIFSFKRRRILSNDQDLFAREYQKKPNPLFYKNRYTTTPQTEILFARKSDKALLSYLTQRSKNLNKTLEQKKSQIKFQIIEGAENVLLDERSLEIAEISKPSSIIYMCKDLEEVYCEKSEHESSFKLMEDSKIVNLEEEDSLNEEMLKNQSEVEDSYIQEQTNIEEEYKTLTIGHNQPLSFEQFVKLKNFLHTKKTEIHSTQVLGNFLKKESLVALVRGDWINDEIINCYIDLLNRRDKSDSVFIVNSFFYEKLKTSFQNKDYSFEKMAKFWEKKNVNLLHCRLVLIPINLNNLHWALVAVNIHERKMEYFDSLKLEADGFKVMHELSTVFTDFLKKHKHKEEEANFFNDENLGKLPVTTIQTDEEQKFSNSFLSNISNIEGPPGGNANTTINNIKYKSNFSSDNSDSENDLQMISSFWNFKVPNVCAQTNGSDCGVFLLKFLDFLSRAERITFTQEEIKYFRHLIAIELIEGRLSL